MKDLYLILMLFLQQIISVTNAQNMFTIKTPDGNNFFVSIISKKEADSLETKFLHSKLEDSLLPYDFRPVYIIHNDKVLYRQFNEDIGFVFPNITEFSMVVRGKNYWSVSVQPTDDHNNLLIPNEKITRLAVAFSINPATANNFRKDIIREITEYESFEGNHFYLLKDNSVVELRTRTADLSDGEWFCSLRDFDFFYYVFSGKERLKLST